MGPDLTLRVVSDEAKARDLIGQLRNRALKAGGNFEYLGMDAVREILGASEEDSLAAVLFADARGWGKAFRSIGSPGPLGFALRAPGFAEAGRDSGAEGFSVKFGNDDTKAI